MRRFKELATTLISIGYLLATLPARAELPPDAVINGVYREIVHIHGYRAAPRIKVVRDGYPSRCGSVSFAGYCPSNHTVYITDTGIKLAYNFGDAALAYILAHEYAHAMQTAYGFTPRITPISELQADCLAGFYLGKIPNISFDRRDIQEISALAYNVGDFSYWDKNHHGTPVQRLNAVTRGIQASVYSSTAACF